MAAVIGKSMSKLTAQNSLISASLPGSWSPKS
jgi:hypothetical protein